MKKGTALTILVLILLAAACHIKPAPVTFKPSPPDTSNTWIKFISPAVWAQEPLFLPHDDYTERVTMITRDSVFFDSVDANTAKKIWRRDTAYIVSLTVPQMNEQKKPLLDSAGHIIYKVWFLKIPDTSILQDYHTKLQ